MKSKAKVSALCFFLLLSMNFISSCKKNITLDINKTLYFPVPQGTAVNTPYIESYPLSTSVLELSVNNIQPSEVKELRLQSLILSIASPAGKNFNLLKSIRVYAYADGLSPILAGYLDSIPLNQTGLGMQMTDESLAEIANRQDFYIKAEAVFDEEVTEEIYIQAQMSFYIKAKVKIH